LAIRFAILFGVASVSGLFALLTALPRVPEGCEDENGFTFGQTVNKRAVLDMCWQCPILGAEALAEDQSV